MQPIALGTPEHDLVSIDSPVFCQYLASGLFSLQVQPAYYAVSCLTDDFNTPDDGILFLLVGIEIGFGRVLDVCADESRGF